MLLVDFAKAFDTVNKEVLWNILQKLGYPDNFIKVIFALYTGMKVSVSFRGERSEPFDIVNRVKQGYDLALTMFSIFLSIISSDAFADSTQRVWI